MHNGSKETYEHIADSWINPNFFHSARDSWYRMGPLGALGDMILSSLPEGDVSEVGVGESSIYLSNVARKYRRHIFHCDLAPDKIINPLTVPGYLFPEALQISEPHKLYGYGYSHFYMGYSDAFYTELRERNIKLALSFIDGDHVYEQAKKDFENAVTLAVDNGYIILHDTYPPSEEYLCPDSKCGDVYRLRQDIEADARFDCLTLTRGVAMDVGLTICRVKPKHRPYFQQ